MKEYFLLTVMMMFSSSTFAALGAQTAVSGSDSTSCSGMGLESNVGRWCGAIMKILNDTSTCAGEEASKKTRLKNAANICPQAGDALSKEHWQAIIASMIQVESSGKCTAKGDGGKSLGLLQSTSGDSAPNPKSKTECKGDQTNCEVGLKCGMCLAMSNANSAGILYQDGGSNTGNLVAAAEFVEKWFNVVADLAIPIANAKLTNGEGGKNPGLAKMFGPWRPKNKAHSKQLKLAKQACAKAVPANSTGTIPGSITGGPVFGIPTR
ncbi:MAG: hypothetical protein AB7F86_05175 [Bdellovibrionales bacterium]